MTRDELNAFCGSLPYTNHVVQWGNSDCWKVGEKVFCVGGWNDADELGVTFKTSLLAFDILKDQAGCRPAPYLASRGMKWIQRTSDETMSDDDLKDYLIASYRLAFANLTKKRQRELASPLVENI